MKLDKKTVFFVIVALGILYLFSFQASQTSEAYLEAKYEAQERADEAEKKAQESTLRAIVAETKLAEALEKLEEVEEKAIRKVRDVELAAKVALAEGKPTSLEDVLTTKYLNLLRDTITGAAYASIENSLVPGLGDYAALGKQPYSEHNRRLGLDWPSIGFSMIGTVRMDGLRNALDNVTNAGIEGDFVECGVWRGGASIFAAGYFDIKRITNRDIWVVDSFEGLPEARTGHDLAMWSKMDYLRVSQPTVQKNFESLGVYDEQRIHFVKGYFVNSLPGIKVKQIALLRMDGDMYESTMDQLFNLYERVSIGGWILVDDYGVIEDCVKAVTDFRTWHDINAPIITLEDKSVYWIKEKQIKTQMDKYWPLLPTQKPTATKTTKK